MQSFLLAAVSPFLANILSQAGTSFYPFISHFHNSCKKLHFFTILARSYIFSHFLQAGTSSPSISIPSCSGSLLSSLITSLVGFLICHFLLIPSLFFFFFHFHVLYQPPPCFFLLHLSNFYQSPPLVDGKAFNEEESSLAFLLGIHQSSGKIGICQPSGKIKTRPNIAGEKNYGKTTQVATNVDDKSDLKLKTVVMSRGEDYKIKSEITKETCIATESTLAEDHLDLNKSGLQTSNVLRSRSSMCEVCAKIFRKKCKLKAHMKVHERKALGKDSRESLLKGHSGSKKQCQVCSLSVLHLAAHMKNVHGEKKFVTCATCGQDKRSKRILEHEKLCKMSEDERAAYNATKRVECEKCHKILAHKDKLRRHLESVHNKNKLLKCEHCEHKDSRSDNMKTHMKNNHINLK